VIAFLRHHLRTEDDRVLATLLFTDIVELVDRGLHELDGIPGKWRLYAAA
jgi:hypothetical protein